MKLIQDIRRFLVTLWILQVMKRLLPNLLTWFNISTLRFKPIVYIVSIFTSISTIFLFLTPYLARDLQSFKIHDESNSNYPNIILIIVDALSAEDMSLFGYKIDTTPNLKEITRDWSKYENAQSPSNCSVQIYPNLITGRYANKYCQYSKTGDMIRRSDNWVNLFEILKQAGYETWWSGYKLPGFYHTGAGIDHMFAIPSNDAFRVAWIQMDGVRFKYFPYIPAFFFPIAHFLEDLGPSGDIYTIGYDLFANKTMRPPFFIYIHYWGVHGLPYPSGSFLGTLLPLKAGLIDRESQQKLWWKYDLNLQPQVDNLHLRYDEAVLNQDAHLKDLIDIIKKDGFYDSSMIIIMADHGQVFNHGFTTHCVNLLSYAETHVPLLIKYPFQRSGDTISTLVSTIDLTPTILDVAGIEYNKEWFEGKSLLTMGEGNEGNRYVFSSLGCDPNYAAVINNRYKMNIYGDDFFLFDYLLDPVENNNLIFTLGWNSDIVREAKQRLEEFRNQLVNH